MSDTTTPAHVTEALRSHEIDAGGVCRVCGRLWGSRTDLAEHLARDVVQPLIDAAEGSLASLLAELDELADRHGKSGEYLTDPLMRHHWNEFTKALRHVLAKYALDTTTEPFNDPISIVKYGHEVAPDTTTEPDPDYMCPNCVTPWKCNGPHIPEPDTTTDSDGGTSDE